MKVLVTGGSGSIGSCIVDFFKDNGHDVFCPSKEQLDLRANVMLHNPEYDVVVNNAGINPLRAIENICDNEVMQVNYNSALQIVQQCIPYMLSAGYGRIINIGSIWKDFAKPCRLAYSASKNALHALTKAIAAEYAEANILANTVSPGFVESKMTYANNSTYEIEKLLLSIPAKRLGKPFEVAKLVYQMSIENTYITGQNIIIDGGYSCSAS